MSVDRGVGLQCSRIEHCDVSHHGESDGRARGAPRSSGMARVDGRARGAASRSSGVPVRLTRECMVLDCAGRGRRAHPVPPTQHPTLRPTRRLADCGGETRSRAVGARDIGSADQPRVRAARRAGSYCQSRVLELRCHTDRSVTQRWLSCSRGPPSARGLVRVRETHFELALPTTLGA